MRSNLSACHAIQSQEAGQITRTRHVIKTSMAFECLWIIKSEPSKLQQFVAGLAQKSIEIMIIDAIFGGASTLRLHKNHGQHNKVQWPAFPVPSSLAGGVQVSARTGNHFVIVQLPSDSRTVAGDAHEHRKRWSMDCNNVSKSISDQGLMVKESSFNKTISIRPVAKKSSRQGT